MSKSLEELLQEKPVSRLKIYAWSTKEIPKYKGCLKIGQTTIDVRNRIIQSQGQSRFEFRVEVESLAERNDGTVFTDHELRNRLKAKGFENVELEWMRCTANDVMTAIVELQTGAEVPGSHYETFMLRPEQVDAVDRTYGYFQSIWNEETGRIPRFLWNAKMRFGKTFAAYHLAKKLECTRVLVVTFKPAVEDSWQTDIESHVDFSEWQYLSRQNGGDPSAADSSRPFVYFGSFQDLLGKDQLGNIKAKNAWLHEIDWDLVIFDEYHFGAWRENAKELFEGEESAEAVAETAAEYNPELEGFNEELDELRESEQEFLPITTKAYLYLSGTPFRALSTGEFIEEQVFNWTYTDEQRAKQNWSTAFPETRNPYSSLPEMRLFTYQMPDELIAIAGQGEFDEFDLNEFFSASGKGSKAKFKHKSEVQKWLDIIRGAYSASHMDNLKLGSSKPPFPYSDTRLLPYLQHSFWFFYSEASCHAMKNLLLERQNVFFHDYNVLSVAGAGAGVGLKALPPVRKAIGNGNDTKTITLSCGKLATGVTIPQWSSILMLRNLKSPETYFQAAFRVQSPWSIRNPNGDDPNSEQVLKPICFVFDFAPTRALRQVSEYAMGLNPNTSNPEGAVADLVNFLPVLAYDGSHMTQVDAGGILDIAMAGTTGTLLARKWESALLVNVDNETLRRVLENPGAKQAIMNIEGFRALGDSVFETIINKSEKVKDTKRAKGDDITPKELKEITAEEREYKSLRKQVQEKLIKFATRIPAFMYLTDFRENTLRDVITKLEPDLFRNVTGLTVDDFNLLVSLNVFNSAHMNQAVFAFRRYEDSSLSYTGLESHEGLTHIGLYDTVVAKESNV